MTPKTGNTGITNPLGHYYVLNNLNIYTQHTWDIKMTHSLSHIPQGFCLGQLLHKMLYSTGGVCFRTGSDSKESLVIVPEIAPTLE